MSNAKYHHLIPQTYMDAWANKSGTLRVRFLDDPNNDVFRNKARIAGSVQFYSIKAGMPICTQEDAAFLFKPVSSFIVKLNGEVLDSPLRLNDCFVDFDDWEIYRADGSKVRKKGIKAKIEQSKILEIEEKWSTKYENRWNEVVDTIEKSVHMNSGSCIPEFEKSYLTEFYIALDWRGFTSNCCFEEAFLESTRGIPLDIEIPESERILPGLKTPAEEMRHYVLLEYYRQYLNESGVIYEDVKSALMRTSFHFLVAAGEASFVTSDTPAFTWEREDGKLVGVLPVAPKILLLKGSCSGNASVYYASRINDEAVEQLNDVICSKASEFVIKPYNL